MRRHCGDLNTHLEERSVTEAFQITREQAEAYEKLFVPALFAQWAPLMVDIAKIADGQRVLDVACGTGVAARAAAGRVGLTGSVVGLDLNPAMLEVAAGTPSDIEWRQGDAANLPFGDGEFDAVLCQSALFFFPDVDAAVAEMARVVRPGGAVAVQTYASLDDQPGFRELDAVVRRIAAADALQLLDTYWSQGDLSILCKTLSRAGLDIVETRTTLGTAMYGSVENLIEIEVKGTPLADRLSDDQISQILAESTDIFGKFLTLAGRLEMPIRAHLVTGRKQVP
ncbi:MAG TPA: methyltransferase domain-containing protein [Propionibacteriaceae bacterium]